MDVMVIILYFALGVLNIGLLYLITNIYRRKTGIDLFPGRASGDKTDMILNIVAYGISGYFGTVVLLLFGIFLFEIWVKFYRKK